MSYAIERAVNEFKTDLDKYGIRVDVNARVIIINDVARQYDPYTEYRVYARDFKNYIKLAKEAEQKRQQAKQGRLL